MRLARLGDMREASAVIFAILTVAATGAATAKSPYKVDEPLRRAALQAASLWRPTDVAAADLKRGPDGPGFFPFRATVVCEYTKKQLSGNSPKFSCTTADGDELKVKYGGTNAEVYGEVLSTRLLWALGFGADRIYPVNLVCRGCPDWLGGNARPDGTSRFDPAVVERKFAGREFDEENGGWGFDELNVMMDKGVGPPRAHYDALKLLAVFVQHTDSKPAQQRLVCRGAARKGCDDPFLMIHDVGMTFGHANLSNANRFAVDLTAWRDTPIWKEGPGCIGNLPRSFSGSLNDPIISESGRRFLAGLLSRLSDRQLRDLFEAAQVTQRLRNPSDARSGFGTVDEWVEAFRDKRRQIVERRCP